MANTLEFGYNAGLPKDCTCAWGARAIIERSYLNPFDLSGETRYYKKRKQAKKPKQREWRVCLVPGRKACFGELDKTDKLVKTLQANIDKILDKASEYLENGYLSFSEPMEACIFAGSGVKVVANSNGSYGYLYMCAFFDDCGD